LVFRPRFYQRHKNLKYFEPWSYRIWPSSVTGWCSWWAYQEKFNQKDLDQIVETLATLNLPEFGYRYVQIDDCYERGRGDASVWLRWNEKFPGGPGYAARKIRSGGMDPAIWVGVNNNDDRSVREHPDWFVRDALGHRSLD
jgi:alpha-galactosidase